MRIATDITHIAHIAHIENVPLVETLAESKEFGWEKDHMIDMWNSDADHFLIVIHRRIN